MSPKLSSIINFSRFAADSAEWKRAGRIVFLIVAVPLFAMFLACEYVGWNLGEDLSPEEGARLQTADPRIVWDSASFSSHYRFKLARVEVVKPDVLVLGQSRMRSLSAGMFAPYSFYNLYRTVVSVQRVHRNAWPHPQGLQPEGDHLRSRLLHV